MSNRAWFDIAIDGRPSGRLVFELFEEQAPKTVANFKALCTGEKGSTKTGKYLHYKGCKFFTVLPRFMCQSGDFINQDGSGGESIYGGKFNDENFSIKHNIPGLLTMANTGNNTNTSQFMITFVPCPWQDGKNVVFGKLVEGVHLTKEIEKVGSNSGQTKLAVKIEDCGLC